MTEIEISLGLRLRIHASQPGTSQQHTRMSWSMSSHYNPVTDHPFSGMSSPPALIHKRKRNEVTADAASQDATPPPKKATHPEDYTLTCCICRKDFTGAGHNPWGYIRRWWCKEAKRYKSYRFRASRYGQVTNRCCAQCNTMVMKWRGQDGMP
jgi:hypothetical protein